MTIGNPDLSVVLLCYRSEDDSQSYTNELKTYLMELNIDWKVILVANYVSGTNDRTPENGSNTLCEYLLCPPLCVLGAGLKRKHEWTHSTIFTKVQAIGQRHTTATQTHHGSTQSQA